MSNLAKTMDAIADLHKSHGVKQKGGKLYTQVVHRMEAFRRIHGTDFGVDTQILVNDGTKVVVKAIITDKDGRVIGSGMAEEIRGQGMVNTTSALENAETSAIGRALSSLGLAGGEYASANEMDAVIRKTDAIEQQKVVVKPVEEVPKPKPLLEQPTITTEERREKHQDKIKDFDHWCGQKKVVQELHAYFNESKVTLEEIKKHNPDIFSKIIDVFTKHETLLERKFNG
jgi:hypothetical protein